jgi:hypothetical protein
MHSILNSGFPRSAASLNFIFSRTNVCCVHGSDRTHEKRLYQYHCENELF